MQGIGFRFSRTALVAVSLVVGLLLSPPSRAGEGTEKTPPAAKASKPSFTLLNANQIPANATPLARLNAARVAVHWPPKDGTTLRQVFTDLGRMIGVQLIFLPEARKIVARWESGLREDRAVSPIDSTLRNIPARGYLDYLVYAINGFWSVNLCWDIHDGKIVVYEREEFPWEMLKGRVHRLGKLSELDEAVPNRSVPALGLAGGPDSEIVDLVTCMVAPESWQECEGPGSIATMEFPGGKVLVVRNYREIQDQVATLIVTLNQMLDEKELVVERSLDKMFAQNYSEMMQKKVTLDTEVKFDDDGMLDTVEGMLLLDFVAELEKQTGMSILVDQVALDSSGVRADTPVIYLGKLRQAKPLRFIVDRLWNLDSEAVSWISRFGVLEITAYEQECHSLCTSVFETSDLTKMSESSMHDMDSLIDLIFWSVAPGEWEGVGGPGAMCPVSLQGRSFLVVRQTEEAMERVRHFLSGLRAIRDKKLKDFPSPCKEDQQVVERLQKRQDWDVKEGTKFADFIASLERRLGVVVFLDEINLGGLGISSDELQLESVHVKDLSAADFLDVLLDPYDMGWMVRHGEILISDKEEIEDPLFTKLYEVSDLTACVDDQGDEFHDFDSLIEFLYMVGPEHPLAQLGSVSNMTEYSCGEQNVLAVLQTYHGHQKIDRLLADLRAALPKKSAKRVLPVRRRPWFRRLKVLR